MHGDEMQGEADEEVDEEEAGRQAEEAAFQPFEPDDCSTPGEGFEVAHCPERLPNDIKVADKLALWFGPPYNTWHVGNVAEVNYRRTKSENVSVEFKDDTDGETRGKFLATADTYGANKLWVLLKPIAINLDSDDDDDEAGAGSSGDAPSSSSKRPKDDTTEAASPPPPPPLRPRKPGSEAAPRAAPRTPN